MAKPLNQIEVNDLVSWHKGTLRILEDAMSFSTAADLDNVKSRFNVLRKQGAFESSFLAAASNLPFSLDNDISDFLNSALIYYEEEQAKEECRSCYEKHSRKVREAFECLDRSYSKLGWLFSSAKKNEATINAFNLLRNLKTDDYAALEVIRFNRSLEKAANKAPEITRGYLTDPESFVRKLEYCNLQLDEPDSLSLKIADMAAALKNLPTQAAAVRESCDGFRGNVVRAINALRDAKVDDVLKSASIDALKPYVRYSAISSLRHHGIETLYEVCRMSTATLEGYRGIGWKTASQIVDAASEAKKKASSTTRIRLSADNKNAAASELVRETFVLMRAIKLYDGVLPTSSQEYRSACRIAENLSSFKNSIHWFFSPNLVKTNYLSAYREGDQILSSAWAKATKTAYVSIENFKAQSSAHSQLTAEAWTAFENDPIPFFNLIESVCPDALGDDDNLRLGLPENLAKEIDETLFSLDGLRCELRRYQEIGLKYILHQKKTLLGDEMGLGKTIQAIAAMVALRNAGGSHFLVVCPAAVITNWCRETSNHSDLAVVKVHGQDKRWRLADWAKGGGVAITNYESLNAVLKNEVPRIDLLVVDEAHYVKNPDSLRSKNVTKLSSYAPRLLFMTGTALENRVDEMIELINYLRPDIANEIKAYATCHNSDAFVKAVAPVYYRRKREDVLSELPELIESNTWCELESEEEEFYEDCVLRRDITGIRRVSWNAPNPKRSSKLNMLKEIIREAEEDGRKVIAFSFYLDTLKTIHEEFGRKAFAPITGSVAPKQRQETIDAFSKAPAGSVLPAQIIAGGTGLNIQTASIVVICEPQYKPSTESQAISRAYRMGQARNVLAYKLLSVGTLDEKIVRILDHKREVFDEFADESEAAESELTIAESYIDSLLAEETERIRQKRNLSEEQVSALRRSSNSRNTDPTEAPSITEQSESQRPIAPTPKRGKKPRTKRFKFKVAGLNKMGTQDLWLYGAHGSIEAVREPHNRYDKNAIALHINGVNAGYVPRIRASNIAPLMDDGYTAQVELIESDEAPKRKKIKDEWGEYSYEDDYDHMYAYARIEMVLKPPAHTSSKGMELSDTPWSNISLKKSTKSSDKKKEMRPFLTCEEAEELVEKQIRGLTGRQTEVMALLAQGIAKSDAAFELGIKTSTIQDHVKLIYKKLDVHSTKELVKYARDILDGKKS